MTGLRQQIADVINGAHTAMATINNEFDLASLACLVTHLWPAMYPSQNQYAADNILVESLSLWKPEFAELACDTWLHARGPREDFSSLAIYHMMNIMLHTNLTVLQIFAHSAPGSEARDPEKSPAAREVYAWTQDRHHQIARWHAEQIITTLERSFTSSTNKAELQTSQHLLSRPSFSSTEPRRLPYESPHIPYAVYYATLVLWCGMVTEQGHGSASPSVEAPIARGERILSLHKVHIAQLLARVLNGIK